MTAVDELVLPHGIGEHAELLLPPDAPLELWRGERRNGLGASDLSTILGLNPWQDLHGLWLDKVHGIGQDENWRMRIGTALEPIVRGIFEEQQELEVEACGLLQSRAHPFLRCTPDGITSDGGLFEAKTTSWWNAEAWADDQTADHAEVQVHGGMIVTGIRHAWVAAMVDGNPDRVHIRRVEYDAELAELIVAASEAFWTQYVEARVEPPLTGASLAWAREHFPLREPEQTVDIGAAGRELFDQLTAARRARRAAENRCKSIEAQLIALTGGAGRIEALGVPLGTRKTVTTRRVSQDLMREAGLDPDDYKTATESTRFYWKGA